MSQANMGVSLSFPKAWTLGHRMLRDLLEGPVEITEKVDGSQFGFGMIDGDLYCRSKPQQNIQNNPPNVFQNAVEHARGLFSQGNLPPDVMFWGEVLNKPKHNKVLYERVPRGGIALFSAQFSDGSWMSHGVLAMYADFFKLSQVPLLYYGKVSPEGEELVSALNAFLELDSFLGGSKIEGVVIKNYAKDFMIGDRYFPFTAAKYVSPSFKEKNNASQKSSKSAQGKLDRLSEMYRTTARWEKAVQHLSEAGELQFAPEDIGNLVLEVKRDIIEENKEEIKNEMWNMFQKSFFKGATRGFPEWYKQKLLEVE